MNAIFRISLLSFVAVCLLPATAQGQEDEATAAVLAAPSAPCDRPEALSNLQRKIVEQSANGLTPLIRFIHRTHMIYRLDIYQTVAWLEQRRAARAECGVAVADADPAK